MGNSNSFKKDPNVDIYLELERQFYFSGDYVEGCVYINCKFASSYSQLILQFEGLQEVYWTESHSNNYNGHTHHHTDYYQNKLVTYREQIVLNNFNGNIPQGQYTFPFCFLLPNALSGSLYDNQSNFIRYRLDAIIQPSSNANEVQYFPVIVNILQKMRNPIGPVQIQTFRKLQCCGCCIDYGQVRIGMCSNTNYLRNGDVFVLNGYMNLQNCKEDIKQIKISIAQHRIWISSGGRQKSTKYDYVLTPLAQNFQKGKTMNFQKECVVPQQIHGSTSIGSCIARFYTINLSYSIGCCTYGTQSDIHVIFNSLTPVLERSQRFPAPQNWNPVYAKKVIYQNMKPFIYSPLPAIPFYHQSGMPIQFNHAVSPYLGYGTFNDQGAIYKPNPNVYPNMQQYPPNQVTGQYSSQNINQDNKI